MQLRLRKFNPSVIKSGSVCVVIGKRNTGKSVLAKDIMFHKRDDLPQGIVLSGTEEGNCFYGGWIPDSFVYNDFDRNAIQTLIATQKKRRKAGTLEPVFLILDDCMYDKKLLKEKCMRYLFMNGRHLNIFLLLTAQYCGDLGPDIRTNIDYVFVLRDNITSNRERLFKNFFGLMPSFASFCQLMDGTTEKYHCLVLDNTSQSNNMEDCLFWYKARADHSFRMGSPAVWRFHQSNYNPNHDETDKTTRTAAASTAAARKPHLRVTRLK